MYGDLLSFEPHARQQGLVNDLFRIVNIEGCTDAQWDLLCEVSHIVLDKEWADTNFHYTV